MNTEETKTPTAAEGQAPEAMPQQEAPAPRRIAGLKAGRIVEYVMLHKKNRPMMVFDAGDGTGPIKGVLFFDAVEDNQQHPHPLLPDRSGFLPTCITLVPNVNFDSADEPAPGTWHWPQRDAVIASAVDKAALDTQVAALIEPIIESIKGQLEQNIASVNLKIEAMVTACNTACEANLKACEDMLAAAKAGSPAP